MKGKLKVDSNSRRDESESGGLTSYTDISALLK